MFRGANYEFGERECSGKVVKIPHFFFDIMSSSRKVCQVVTVYRDHDTSNSLYLSLHHLKNVNGFSFSHYTVAQFIYYKYLAL